MKPKIQLLKRNSFPAHAFFDHLIRGTDFYQNRNFERAAEEWGAAGWLNYDTPVNLGRPDGRIFCGGILREVPFLFFLYAVYANRSDGIGAIKTGHISKSMIFQGGRLVRAATTRREERIGQLIIQRERLSPLTLNMLANDARKAGKRIGQFLVEKGVLSDDALKDLLFQQNEQILVDILGWQSGYFYFFEKPIGSAGIVNYDPLNLARAATTRSCGLAQFQNRIPHMQTIFRLAPHAEAKQAEILNKLSNPDRFVFSLINGTRNIRQIARFSGIDDPQAVEALYRLHRAGMIRQSREIIEYEDRQFGEIANLLDTLLEIYADVARNLILELGTKARNVIRRSRSAVAQTHSGMFADLPWENPDRITRELVLRNIANSCPDPARKELFIDAFCDLFRDLQQSGSIYLGNAFARRVTEKIREELKNVMRYAKESALRSHLFETFDQLLNPPRRTDAQYHA